MSRVATWFKNKRRLLLGKLRGVFDVRRAVVFPRGDGAWTQIDAQNLKAFLASSTGLRLTAKLRNMESASAISGAKDVMHTVHSAGVTNGISSTLDYFYSLTHTFDRTKATQEQFAESAEQKAERELLERIGAI